MIFDVHIGPENLSPSSKVWIYQASRLLSDSEIKLIQEQLQVFIPGWTAHDELLEASGGIHKKLFIVLVADLSKTGASGCSIDKSIKMIQSFESKIGVEFLNRFNVAFYNEGMLEVANAAEFGSMVQQDKVSDSTLVFNNMVASLSELDTDWEVAFVDSWHKNYFSTN